MLLITCFIRRFEAEASPLYRRWRLLWAHHANSVSRPSIKGTCTVEPSLFHKSYPNENDLCLNEGWSPLPLPKGVVASLVEGPSSKIFRGNSKPLSLPTANVRKFSDDTLKFPKIRRFRKIERWRTHGVQRGFAVLSFAATAGFNLRRSLLSLILMITCYMDTEKLTQLMIVSVFFNLIIVHLFGCSVTELWTMSPKGLYELCTKTAKMILVLFWGYLFRYISMYETNSCSWGKF